MQKKEGEENVKKQSHKSYLQFGTVNCCLIILKAQREFCGSREHQQQCCTAMY